MTRHLRGRAGSALAIVLILLVASAGTATATRLITGAQIKDGSVGARDLARTVRTQLARAGSTAVPGPPGQAGPAGAEGPQGIPGRRGSRAPPARRDRAGPRRSWSGP